MKMEIKYAPKNLGEVIYPNIATQRRINGFAEGVLSGHLILFGPNGTAKTTTAELLITAIGGPDALVDKDFASLLALPDLKDYMQKSVQTGRMSTSGKYFQLFNEFDNAKSDMHKYWTAMDACGDGLMTVITTNNPISIHQSIRSRCTLIQLPGLTAENVLARSQYILQAEGLVLPDMQVLHYLKQQEKDHDLRKYMGVLDQLLYLQNLGLPMPAWGKLTKTNLRVI
jgi:replication factor C subunit 3/5